MMLKKFLFTAGLLLVVFSAGQPARADDNTLAAAYAHFQEGDYAAALKSVETPRSDPKKEIGRLYLRAECQSRLQQFDKALSSYASLREYQKKHPVIALPVELSYLEGQAFYATKNFSKARARFQDSIRTGYRVGSSYYYAGFVSELLGDITTALKDYKAILALPDDPDKVKQAALFRIAEVSYEQSGDKKPERRRLYLSDEVLPMYQRAVDFDPATEIANGAQGRIREVQARVGALGPQLRNGVPVPLSPFSFHMAEDFGWDSNVATITNQSPVSIAHKDSFFVKPSALGRYQANLSNTVSLVPELGGDFTYYTRRDVPLIYQNDNADVMAALRGRYDHNAFQRPAAMLLDLSYLLMLRDYQQRHRLSFYSGSYELAFGELLRIFDTGPTVFKLHYQLYNNETSDRSAMIPAFSIDQIVRLSRWDWSNSLSVNYVRARNEEFDERNYGLRSLIFFPEALGLWNLAPALAVNLKDTMNLQASRGYEVNLNPTLDASRSLAKHLVLHLLYGYTHYFSRDTANYVYTEHVVTTSFREDF